MPGRAGSVLSWVYKLCAGCLSWCKSNLCLKVNLSMRYIWKVMMVSLSVGGSSLSSIWFCKRQCQLVYLLPALKKCITFFCWFQGNSQNFPRHCDKLKSSIFNMWNWNWKWNWGPTTIWHNIENVTFLNDFTQRYI